MARDDGKVKQHLRQHLDWTAVVRVWKRYDKQPPESGSSTAERDSRDKTAVRSPAYELSFDYDGAPVVVPRGSRRVQGGGPTRPAPAIGERMKDGTVFAGISPDTGMAMYALPADAPLTLTWKEAMDVAAGFHHYGCPKATFRVPTLGELNVLFQNRAAIGGFNETRAGWYWSAMAAGSAHPGDAMGQRFDAGWQAGCYDKASLRLVRG